MPRPRTAVLSIAAPPPLRDPPTHPRRGKNAIFGTNPLCIAIPGPADGPVILDMATAATTLFGTISTKAAGKKLPPGVAVDADGRGLGSGARS